MEFCLKKHDIFKLHLESNERIGKICTIIESSALGLILSKCLQYVKETDLMSAYIHDFLCMDYPVCSDNELEVSYCFYSYFEIDIIKNVKVLLIFHIICIQTIVTEIESIFLSFLFK